MSIDIVGRPSLSSPLLVRNILYRRVNNDLRFRKHNKTICHSLDKHADKGPVEKNYELGYPLSWI